MRDRKYNIMDPFRVTIKSPILWVVVNLRIIIIEIFIKTYYMVFQIFTILTKGDEDV